MPHRDPETGQFVTSIDRRGFDQIETLRGYVAGNIEDGAFSDSSDGDFGEGAVVEGQTMVDFGEILDRNEVGHILEAHHWMTAYIKNPSEQTDLGVLRAVAEFSASPALQVGFALDEANLTEGEPETPPGSADTVLDVDWLLNTTEDTQDVIGRPLMVVNQSAVRFVDLTNGVGVGQSASFNSDSWSGTVPDFEVDDRDEVYLNAVLEGDGIELVPDKSNWLEAQVYYVVGVSDR